MTTRYPNGSVEFQPVIVTVDGVQVFTGVQLSVVPFWTEHTTWVDPITLDGQIGFMVGSYAPGNYTVWAQVTDSPEHPYINCGDFVIESL